MNNCEIKDLICFCLETSVIIYWQVFINIRPFNIYPNSTDRHYCLIFINVINEETKAQTS